MVGVGEDGKEEMSARVMATHLVEDTSHGGGEVQEVDGEGKPGGRMWRLESRR